MCMKRVCAWCKIDMGTKPIEGHSENAVTHGICAVCLDTFFQLRQSALIDILDRIEAPVIVIDSTVCVRSANTLAQRFLQKELPDIEGVITGDVVECSYAKLAGGCGTTSHCDGCMIRNTVQDTFLTGKSHLKVPARLLQGDADKNLEINLLLTTEKVNDVVLLRFELD